jgi:hypothetical protein
LPRVRFHRTLTRCEFRHCAPVYGSAQKLAGFLFEFDSPEQTSLAIRQRIGDALPDQRRIWLAALGIVFGSQPAQINTQIEWKLPSLSAGHDPDSLYFLVDGRRISRRSLRQW